LEYPPGIVSRRKRKRDNNKRNKRLRFITASILLSVSSSVHDTSNEKAMLPPSAGSEPLLGITLPSQIVVESEDTSLNNPPPSPRLFDHLREEIRKGKVCITSFVNHHTLNFYERPMQHDNSPPPDASPLITPVDIAEDGFPSHESVLQQIAADESTKEQVVLRAHISQPEASNSLSIAEEGGVHSHNDDFVGEHDEQVNTAETDGKQRRLLGSSRYIEKRPGIEQLIELTCDGSALTKGMRRNFKNKYTTNTGCLGADCGYPTHEDGDKETQTVPSVVNDGRSETVTAPDPPLLLPPLTGGVKVSVQANSHFS
jgi:hypothetical protein